MAVTSVGRSTPSEADSTRLVRLAQRGDAAAFDRLAAERIDGAYRLAAAILRSEADARDAVQDAFVAAWRQVPGLRDPARFDAWLDRIVVNACRMALRHRRVVRLHEIEVADLGAYTGRSGFGILADASAARVTDTVADEVVGADVVRRAIERLDADKRAILVLHHVEGRPVTEIAAVLGSRPGR
jgi:RNA polymerase sigma-70 factor (ECF subfamily)